MDTLTLAEYRAEEARSRKNVKGSLSSLKREWGACQ
jgi:hypothetical protein